MIDANLDHGATPAPAPDDATAPAAAGSTRGATGAAPDGAEATGDAARERRVSRRALLAGAGIGVAGLAVGAGGMLWWARRYPWVAVPDVAVNTRAIPTRRDRFDAATIVFNVATTAKAVALTFDDGPTDEYTGRVLDVLDDAGALATFNVVGEHVEERPQLVQRAHAAGHEIGNHTWQHDQLVFEDLDFARDSIERTAEIVEATIGTRTRWFRPPRGEITGSIVLGATETGHQTLMWSYTGRMGEAAASPDEHVRAFGSALRPGMICSYHDGLGSHEFKGGSGQKQSLREHRDAELAALPAILAAGQEQGYRFVTVSQLVDLGRRQPARGTT